MFQANTSAVSGSSTQCRSLVDKPDVFKWSGCLQLTIMIRSSAHARTPLSRSVNNKIFNHTDKHTDAFPRKLLFWKLSILCHRFQVYSCISILKVYASEYNCGIVELQGSNGEKANCFFTAKVFHFKKLDGWPKSLSKPNTNFVF